LTLTFIGGEAVPVRAGAGVTVPGVEHFHHLTAALREEMPFKLHLSLDQSMCGMPGAWTKIRILLDGAACTGVQLT